MDTAASHQAAHQQQRCRRCGRIYHHGVRPQWRQIKPLLGSDQSNEVSLQDDRLRSPTGRNIRPAAPPASTIAGDSHGGIWRLLAHAASCLNIDAGAEMSAILPWHASDAINEARSQRKRNEITASRERVEPESYPTAHEIIFSKIKDILMTVMPVLERRRIACRIRQSNGDKRRIRHCPPTAHHARSAPEGARRAHSFIMLLK